MIDHVGTQGEESKALLAPIYHKSDPDSSKAAAAEITSNGVRQGQLKYVLALVRKYPGKTSLELAKFTPYNRYVLARRLPELRTAGLVAMSSESRICSVGLRKAREWSPVYKDDTTEELCLFDSSHEVYE